MTKYQEIVALEKEALLAFDENQFNAAIRAHSHALEIAGELDRPRIIAVLFNRLGNLFEVKGDIQKAVAIYESGLKALASDPGLNIEQELNSISMVGKLPQEEPSHVDVPDLYREETATDLNTAENDPTLHVKLLINIGNAYLRQPQHPPALNSYDLALKRPEIMEAPELRAHVLTHKGVIFRREGDVDKAQNLLEDALNLLEGYADPLQKRQALAVLAGIYRDRKQHVRAVDFFKQALSLYAQVDDTMGEGRTLAGMGHLHLELEHFLEAQNAFQRAVELAETMGDEDTLWHAHWGLGRCLRETCDFEGAAKSYRISLNIIRSRQLKLRTDEGKVSFLESVQDIFDELIAVHLERAKTNPIAYQDALNVAEEARGQALYELVSFRRRKYFSHQRGVRPSRFRSFTERMTMASQMAPGVPLIREVQMSPAVTYNYIGEINGEEIWSEVPNGSWKPDEHQITEPQEKPELEPLARLVFHILPDRTVVFAITPNGKIRCHIAELDEQALVDYVKQIRHTLQVDINPRGMRWVREARRVRQPPRSRYKPLLRKLYLELIEPVADFLPDDGTPVVIEPRGPLWLLPFSALIAPNGTWLIDKWPILYSPSEQVLNEIRSEPDYGGPKDLRALIIGNPAMPMIPQKNDLEIVLDPLPGAEREARAIATLFPLSKKTLLLHSEANLAVTVVQMPQHGIIHLSTHGIAFAEDPLESFIVLGVPKKQVIQQLEDKVKRPYLERLLDDGSSQNGLLTARLVFSIPLPADLVTLSACQTGLGKVSGDGVIGLSRAFLVAGARTVLVSLWSVSDEATTELMVAFYRGYIEIDDKALALQKAIQNLRSKSKFNHPKYWAPFVVVGAEA